MQRTNQNTQRNFFSCLDVQIVNHLLHLFSSDLFVKEIYERRALHGLTNNNVNIHCEIDNSSKQGYTLYIIFKENDLEYLYFSLHLCADTFNSLSPSGKKMLKGPIHFVKSESISRSKLPAFVIRVNKTSDTIYFTLGNQINTKFYIFGPELISEANIILDIINTFLNNILKNNNTTLTLNPHNKVNNILRNMNNYTTLRKNKGKYLKYNRTRKNNGTNNLQ